MEVLWVSIDTSASAHLVEQEKCVSLRIHVILTLVAREEHAAEISLQERWFVDAHLGSKAKTAVRMLMNVLPFPRPVEMTSV